MSAMPAIATKTRSSRGLSPPFEWTWPELKAELGQLALTITRRDPRGFLGKTTEGIRSTGRARARFRDVEWLVLRTPICAQQDMDPELVLERNGRLAFAVMLLSQGTYWLRVAVAVPAPAELCCDPARLVVQLVEGARSLWPYRIAPQACAGDVFQHFTS